MSRPVKLRFRPPGAILAAALVALPGTIAVAGQSWYLAPLLLVPLGVLLWSWRAGTDVRTEGLRVRAVLGSRDIAWSQVRELAADQRGRAFALLTDGRSVRLTSVRRADLPTLLAAGGQGFANDADDADDRTDAAAAADH